MINRIQEKSQACKVILEKIKGDHSFASVESSFYADMNLSDLFLAINHPESIPFFTSDISWINFYDQYNKHGGTKKELGIRVCSGIYSESKAGKFYFRQGKFCSRMRAIRRKI